MIGRLRAWVAAQRIVTLIGPDQICARFGHVQVGLDHHQGGASIVASGCLRCGRVLAERVYTARAPRPRA